MIIRIYCPLKPIPGMRIMAEGPCHTTLSLSLEAPVGETVCAPSNWWGSVPAFP